MKTKMFSLVFVLLFFSYFPNSAYSQKIPDALKDVVKTFQREKAMDASKEGRLQFKEKLKTIRDERKKSLTESIDTKITNSNQKHMSRFEAVLDKLSKILQGISQKVSEAKAKGADRTSLEEAIALAQNSIDSAKVAVDQQKEKTYTIQIPENERGLKGAVGIAVSQFRGDLKETHKKVVEAKQAVMKAEMELAKVK